MDIVKMDYSGVIQGIMLEIYCDTMCKVCMIT